MSAEEELTNLLSEYAPIHRALLDLFSQEAEVALRWLKAPRIQLQGASPLSVLEQDHKQVEDIIYRIKTGDLS